MASSVVATIHHRLYSAYHRPSLGGQVRVISQAGLASSYSGFSTQTRLTYDRWALPSPTRCSAIGQRRCLHCGEVCRDVPFETICHRLPHALADGAGIVQNTIAQTPRLL